MIRSIALLLLFHPTFTQAQAMTGDADCPCIDSRSRFEAVSNCDTINPRTGISEQGVLVGGVCYPSSFGGSVCGTHDQGIDPLCDLTGDAMPGYCLTPFCYVDFEKCKKSRQLMFATDVFAVYDTNLFYSYTTCNSTETSWKDFLTTNALADFSLTSTMPGFWAPAHYKLNDQGEVAEWDGPEYYNDDIPWQGWILDYISAVVEMSNVQAINFTARSGGSDVASGGGSAWTASIHDIQAGISDISTSSYWITSERLQQVAFTTPVSVDKIFLWVEQPHTDNSFGGLASKVMKPFEAEVWILMILAVILVSFLTVLFASPDGDFERWHTVFRNEEWLEASPRKKARIAMVTGLETFVANCTFFFGHHVDFDLQSTMPQKILSLGYAFLVLIAVAAYTANLAAFLTLSGVSDFISSMDEAILRRIPLCAHPVIAEDLSRVWSGATFVYDADYDGDVYEGMLGLYDAGKCGAIVAGMSDVRNSHSLMESFCSRELASTGSLVLEKPVAFPINEKYVAAFSYWMFEAEQNGITFGGYEAKSQPPVVCPLEISTEQKSVDDLLPMTAENFALPFLILSICALLALALHFYGIHQKIRSEVTIPSAGALQKKNKEYVAEPDIEVETEKDLTESVHRTRGDLGTVAEEQSRVECDPEAIVLLEEQVQLTRGDMGMVAEEHSKVECDPEATVMLEEQERSHGSNDLQELVELQRRQQELLDRLLAEKKTN